MIPKYYDYVYKGVNLDPYRICQIYAVGGGPREQIIKKCLRFTSKGQDALTVLDELQSALDRWREMIKEDIQTANLNVVSKHRPAKYLPDEALEIADTDL